MGDKYFDVDEALKDGIPENEVATHLAQLHGINRDDYIKDGLTDSEFLSEFKSKPLSGATTETASTTTTDDNLSDVSNADNAMFGAIAAAAPGAAGYALNKLKGTVLSVAGSKGVPSMDTSTTPAPSKTFASPSQVSSRVTAAGQPPRPAGPTDVVNWASGKDERTGQYGRGYLGGQDMKEEHALHQRANELEAKNPGYKIKPGTTNLLIPEAEYKKLVSDAKAAEISAKENLGNKAKMAAELRANRLAQINSTNIPAKVVNNIGNAPVSKRFMTGYNVGDLLQAQNPFEATVSTVGAAAPYGAGMVEKVLPNKYKPLAKLFGPVAGVAAPAINYIERKLIGPQEDESNINHAAGGPIQHFENGRLAVAKKAAKAAWEHGGTQLGKASEFFGNELEKAQGKKLFWVPTEADRMGGVGGPSFSANQLARPEVYKNNTWGSAEPGVASRYANVAKNPLFGGPESQIWSPLLGSETQHQGNQIMFDELLRHHKKNMDKLSPEDINTINNSFRSGKFKAIQNAPDFDIRDIDQLREMGTTFPIRAAIARHGMGRIGTGGPKSQSFDYDEVLRKLQDPTTLGAPTHSMGPRAFQLDDVGEYRPDLNAAFPHMITGKDKGVLFKPVPKDLALMDYIKLHNEVKGDPGYMGYTKGLKTDWMKANDPKAKAIYPRQEVTPPWIRELERNDFAEGGEVEHFEGGGKVGALAALAKKFLPAAPATGREANLAKYMEKSAVQTPMYHGTAHDIREFKPGTANAIFVTHNPHFAEDFAKHSEEKQVQKIVDKMSGADMKKHFNNDLDTLKGSLPVRENIMQVHVNAQNPFDYGDTQHINNLVAELNKSKYPDGSPMGEGLENTLASGDWDWLEMKHIQEAIRNMGHDSFWVKEGGNKNLGVYDPRQIKSTTGNVGTFDPTNPDIGHAQGGEIQHFQDGRLAVAKKAVSQIPEVAQALEAYLRGHITDAERMNILNKYLPIRKWNELPPNYTDDQIRAALMENKRPKALADVPVGMQVGNRLDIPAYTQNGVYVDTVHNAKGSPISYNRTGHLKDVEFSSKPNQAVRVGLGTKEQALTPMGAEMGSGKSPFALMKGTNIGTKDDEVRRMMQEYLNDPNWTQIGMDPRRNSQFYDKSTGMPVFSATEKLQSGPLVMVPKSGLESSHWQDPRLELSDFEGKHYKEGGLSTPAWQRSEGKNPEGGLNAAGRASYNREHGAHLKAPQPEGGSRKDSFCARMEGMKKKNTSSETANDPDSRINKSLRKWKC